MKKPKNPKSIVISFRLSPAVVAKAIDGLKSYDKSADITKLSSIIKQTTLHGINYLTSALPFEPSESSQVIVHNLTTQGKKGKSIEQSILGQKITCLERPKEKSQKIEDIRTASKQPESYLSQSIKSAVTDFSIPKELMQDLEDEEKKNN